MIELILTAFCHWSSSAHAGASVYAHCTGDGLTVDVGLGPGPGGTDLAQLTVDDGTNNIVGYESVMGRGKADKMLGVGATFESTASPKSTGVFKIDGARASWTAAQRTHRLHCERP